jgi:putative phosphoesterase
MIAVISDIHGNYPALQAVLAEIERYGCESIISLGDVAGYYCQINECVDLLRQKNVLNIMGNHDYYMAYNQACPRSNSANVLLQYQRQVITPKNLDWLRHSSPKIESAAVSFVHGGWRDTLDEYLTVITEEYFQGENATHFFSGHTHIQTLKMFSSICYCNPGSVGQPRDKDPRAAFALFDGQEVRLCRVEYNIDEIARAMAQCGFSRYYYEGLYAGVKIGAAPSVSQDNTRSL